MLFQEYHLRISLINQCVLTHGPATVWIQTIFLVSIRNLECKKKRKFQKVQGRRQTCIQIAPAYISGSRVNSFHLPTTFFFALPIFPLVPQGFGLKIKKKWIWMNNFVGLHWITCSNLEYWKWTEPRRHYRPLQRLTQIDSSNRKRHERMTQQSAQVTFHVTPLGWRKSLQMQRHDITGFPWKCRVIYT